MCDLACIASSVYPAQAIGEWITSPQVAHSPHDPFATPHLCLTIHPGGAFDRVIDVIAMVIQRLEHLQLSIFALSPDSAADIGRNLARALSSPAPMLYTLHITMNTTTGLVYLREDLLDRAPACLRTRSLYDVGLPPSGSCTALSQITALNYTCGDHPGIDAAFGNSRIGGFHCVSVFTGSDVCFSFGTQARSD